MSPHEQEQGRGSAPAPRRSWSVRSCERRDGRLMLYLVASLACSSASMMALRLLYSARLRSCSFSPARPDASKKRAWVRVRVRVKGEGVGQGLGVMVGCLEEACRQRRFHQQMAEAFKKSTARLEGQLVVLGRRAQRRRDVGPIA